jgi:hypothetical protein
VPLRPSASTASNGPNVSDRPDTAPGVGGSAEADGSTTVERRDFGHIVFVIGTDAATVGRAVRAESAGSGGQVLAFVGSPDHPALTEMLSELVSHTAEQTHRS